MLNNDLTKKSLVNTYYDSNDSKLYQVNADGTKGSEIPMSPIKKIQRGTITKNTDPVSVTLTGFTNLDKMIYLINEVYHII